jgi:hypothetical protein
MFAVIAALLVAAWIFGFIVFHVASFGIHLLLIAGLLSLIAHVARGSRSGAA